MFLGTQQENMRDMADKGRAGAHGRWRSLTPELHEEIRARFTGVRGQKAELAREYGVSYSCIHYLVGPLRS